METETQGNGHAHNGHNGAGMSKATRGKVVKPGAFGKALQVARATARMSVKDVAKLIPTTPAVVYRWESGKSVPRDAAMRKLRERFPELPAARPSDLAPIPLFAAPPPVLARNPSPAPAIVEKHYLAREATTATLGDYAEAVGRVEAARRALENAVAEAEAIHAALMGKVKA